MHRTLRVSRVFLVLVQLLFMVEEGWTSTFNVSPLQVVLSGKTSSALVEIKNQSAEPLRLQLSVSSWTQSLSGEMILGDTDEIVLFPSLVALEAGEMRKIRLGAAVPRGEIEKTYRVFIEELPSKDTGPLTGGQIRVLTRLSIPVFLQPAKLKFQGQIAAPTVGDGKAIIEIRNLGNSHFSSRRIQVIGTGAAGQEITKKEFGGWYLLASGTRRYELPLSSQDCRHLRLLTVEVQTEFGSLKGESVIQPEACGR